MSSLFISSIEYFKFKIQHRVLYLCLNINSLLNRFMVIYIVTQLSLNIIISYVISNQNIMQVTEYFKQTDSFLI